MMNSNNNNKCFLVILVFFSLIVASQFTLALQDCAGKTDNTICDWTGSYVCCNGECTNVAWDNENCGACNYMCPETKICSGTECVCRGFLLDCYNSQLEPYPDGVCECDSRSDLCCGGCGNICGGSGVTKSVCSNEMCVCTQTGYVNADGDWSNGCEEYDPPCEDTDGGKNYAVKGTTTWGTITRYDSCEPNNVLREWY